MGTTLSHASTSFKKEATESESNIVSKLKTVEKAQEVHQQARAAVRVAAKAAVALEKEKAKTAAQEIFNKADSKKLMKKAKADVEAAHDKEVQAKADQEV